jgi:hypothetical protein
MPTEVTATSPSEPDITKLLLELEVPFSPDQVQWRVTNTTSDKKRGQVVPYADPRAYTDRLNALFTPQGWTREYKVETMNNITRVKKGEASSPGRCWSPARSPSSAWGHIQGRAKSGLTMTTV